MSQSSYLPYPHSGPPPPAPELPRPLSINLATALMIVQAALGIAGLVVTLATVPSLRVDVADRTSGLSQSTLDLTVEITVIVAVVIALVSVALWALLAVTVHGSRRWAWILALILTVLGLLSLSVSLLRVGVGLSKGISGLSGLLDVALLVLLVARSSRDYVRPR